MVKLIPSPRQEGHCSLLILKVKPRGITFPEFVMEHIFHILTYF